jgi:peptidoglycan/LPS O-acetylase OafA/YrhL
MPHNQELDGLRGIAALSVIVHHFIAAFLPATLFLHFPGLFPVPAPGSLEAVLSFPLLAVLYSGLLPVIIFFVLSGYVLALPYWSGNRDILLRRLWTRYIRLNIPVAASILISFFVLSFGLYFNDPASRYSQSYWLSLWFKPETADYLDLAKQILWGGVTGQIKYNPPLWTIGIELFGSMILLAYFALKPTARNFYAFVAVAIILLMLTGTLITLYPTAWLYFLSIIVGAYLARIKFKNKYLAAAVFCIGLYVGAYVENGVGFGVFPDLGIINSRQFYEVLGATLIVLAVANGFGSWVLRSSICQWLGKVSFAVYLIHFVILCSVTCYVYTLVSDRSWALPLTFACYLFTSYLAAAILGIIDAAAIFSSAWCGAKLFPGSRVQP